MSAVTTCPKCNNTVTVPFGAANDAWVRCRSCGAEYTLAEIVPHAGKEIGLAPPTELEQIGKPDHPAGPRVDHLAAFSPWEDETVEVIEPAEGAEDFVELELADEIEVMDAEVVDAEIVDADVFDTEIMEVDAIELGAEGAPENPSTITNKSDWSQQPTLVDIGEPLQLEEVAEEEISLFDEEPPAAPSPHDTLIYTGPGKRPASPQDDKPEKPEAASLDVSPPVEDAPSPGAQSAAAAEPAPKDDDFFNFLDEPQEADSGDAAELDAYENAFDSPEGAVRAGSTTDESKLDSFADDEPLSLDHFETIESESEEMDDVAAAAFLEESVDADGEPASATADSEDDGFEPIEMTDEDDAIPADHMSPESAKALAAATVVTTKPLRRKRAMNPILSAVMLVLFGGVGILAAIMILFWGFGTDPGIAQYMPSVLVPEALQPKKQRVIASNPIPTVDVPEDVPGDNTTGDNGTTPGDDPDAPPVTPDTGTPGDATAIPATPPDNTTAPSSDKADAPAGTVNTAPPVATVPADPFGEPKIDTSGTTTPGETPADPFASPETPAPATPGPATTVLKPDATPNPFAEPPPADPATPTTEPPASVPAAANPGNTATTTAPATPPDPFAVPETPTDPAATTTLPVVEPPVGSVAPPTAGQSNDEQVFQEVIEKVGEDAKQFQSASTAAKKAKGAFYQSLAKLGEATAHVPADETAPPTDHRPAVAEQVMTRIVTDRALANELGRLANLWLDHPARKEPGIILSGKIEGIRPIGKLFEVVVLLPGSAGEAVRAPRSVPVLFSEKPTAVVGDDLLALGIVVDDPATKLKDYTGDARQVIWGASSMPLNKLSK